MKKLLFILCLIFISASAVFAQNSGKQNNAVASAKKREGSDNYVKKRKSVDATQKAYFKKVGKQNKKAKDCDCPGNPKNKKNRQNPYKRKRGGS